MPRVDTAAWWVGSMAYARQPWKRLSSSRPEPRRAPTSSRNGSAPEGLVTVRRVAVRLSSPAAVAAVEECAARRVRWSSPELAARGVDAQTVVEIQDAGGLFVADHDAARSIHDEHTYGADPAPRGRPGSGSAVAGGGGRSPRPSRGAAGSELRSRARLESDEVAAQLKTLQEELTTWHRFRELAEPEGCARVSRRAEPTALGNPPRAPDLRIRSGPRHPRTSM